MERSEYFAIARRVLVRTILPPLLGAFGAITATHLPAIYEDFCRGAPVTWEAR